MKRITAYILAVLEGLLYALAKPFVVTAAYTVGFVEGLFGFGEDEEQRTLEDKR
mgnify:CR=1 FL=1